MSLVPAMCEVECPAFAARVSVASDLSTLIEAFKVEAGVVELLKLLRADEARNRILVRLGELVHEKSDVRYRNPRDLAITTYAWALTVSTVGDLKWGNIAALTVLAPPAPRCWWAPKMARLILGGGVVPKQTETTVTAFRIEHIQPATLATTGIEADQCLVLDSWTSGEGRMMGADTVLGEGSAGETHRAWVLPAAQWGLTVSNALTTPGFLLAFPLRFDRTGLTA